MTIASPLQQRRVSPWSCWPPLMRETPTPFQNTSECFETQDLHARRCAPFPTCPINCSSLRNESDRSERGRRTEKIFYGWWVVLTSGIGLLFGYAPIFVFSFGVFVRSLVEEFHSNRTQISLAFTLASLMVSVGSPLAGRLVDRFGARRVLLPSIGILGLLLICFKFVST